MEILLIKTADNAKSVVFSLMMLKNRGIIKVMGFMTELTECDGEGRSNRGRRRDRKERDLCGGFTCGGFTCGTL